MYIAKVPNKLLETHECEALVLTCIDFRFWEASLIKFARDSKENGGLGFKHLDPLIVPGVCKGFAESNKVVTDFANFVIQLALEKHHIRKVAVIHHANCGAYGIEDVAAEFETQCVNLRKGAEILSRTFPSLSFSLYFAKKGDGEVIYVPVEA